MHPFAVALAASTGVPAEPANRQHLQRRHHDAGDKNHQRHRIGSVAPEQDYARHNIRRIRRTEGFGHHNRQHVGGNIDHQRGKQQRQRPLQAVLAARRGDHAAARTVGMVRGQDRGAAGTGAQPLLQPADALFRRMRQRRQRRDLLPQPASIHALKGAQLQQAEQAPGPEAGLQTDIAVGHQLDEADQHAGHKDLRHAPAAQLEQDARQAQTQAYRHRYAVHQQNNGQHAERRDRLNECQKQRGQAAVILRHHYPRDLQQRDLAAETRDLHGDKGKQVGQQQHKQRSQRVAGRPFTWFGPVRGQHRMAARAGCTAALRHVRQFYH